MSIKPDVIVKSDLLVPFPTRPPRSTVDLHLIIPSEGNLTAMDPITSLHSLVNVQSTGGLPSTPAKTVPRIYPGAPQREDSIELQRIQRAPLSSEPSWRDGAEAEDVEMSRPASPVLPAEAAEVLPSIWDPYMNRFRFLACCLMNLQNGLNDSAPGALIPYMEK
jgi:hypothetical protein